MEELITSAKEKIPKVDFILEKAWKKLGFNSNAIRRNFSKSLVEMDVEATNIFRGYEKQALLELAEGWLRRQKEDVRKKLEKIVAQKGWDDFVREASRVFVEFGALVQTLEKDLGNMRKARGGKTFEKVILRVLDFIGVKAEVPRGGAKDMLRRIDLVVPSVEIALRTPDRAIFLTCKRTLRERWKQEVPQAKLNQRIYLLTIDEELTEDTAKDINEKGFIAFVRDELKQKEALRQMEWIRRLSDLPKELRRV
jgi:hypothetical protein